LVMYKYKRIIVVPFSKFKNTQKASSTNLTLNNWQYCHLLNCRWFFDTGKNRCKL